MKKLLVLGCMLVGVTSMQAQSQEWNEWNGNNIFEHVGVGVGFGLTGITIDVGSDITDYLTIRGGMDIFPSVSQDFDVKIGFESSFERSLVPTSYNLPGNKVKIEGKTGLGAGHLLFDIHPFKNAFRITTGLYFGKEEIITVENKDNNDFLGIANWNRDVTAFNETGTKAPGLAGIPGLGTAITELPRLGLEMSDYFLAPDNNGHVDASIRVNKVRPYIGLGVGRMVPKKSRLTCNFDFGVQFWGKPEIYLNGIDGEKKLEKKDLGNDGDDVLDILSKITVYPQLTVRLVGRIF
jgi:hypothetical protein